MNPAFHAAIAAAKRRQEQEEEQTMAQYSAEDLNGWEFKIVRSNFGRFRNSEVMRRVIEEEAQNGWEMVEKFDDYRIRFKRRTDRRGLHSGGNVEPYRTSIGVGQRVIPLIAGGVALALALAVMLFQSKSTEGSSSAAPVIVVAVGILLVAMVVALLVLRRR